MQRKTWLIIMFWFTVGYMLFFTVTAVQNGNYEFLYYSIIMSFILLLVVLYHQHFELPLPVMFGLTATTALHIFGGNVYIEGIRLYDVWLWDSIFRYDNLVHLVSTFVATFLAYNLLYPYLDHKVKQNLWVLSILLVLLASGLGALNEIMELGAVIYLGAAQQVGDYMNNAFDLVFNLIGAVAACFFIVVHHWKLQKRVKS